MKQSLFWTKFIVRLSRVCTHGDKETDECAGVCMLSKSGQWIQRTKAFMKQGSNPTHTSHNHP
jgi:hypothetical protein